MESRDEGQRPTLKPTHTGANPPAPPNVSDAEAFEVEFRKEFMQWVKEEKVEQAKRIKGEPDPAWVRAVALGAAATLMASPDAHEEHVISLARRFEGYIRNG